MNRSNAIQRAAATLQWGACLLVLVFGSALIALNSGSRDGAALAQGNASTHSLNAAEVIAALEQAGLPVQDLQQDRIMGGPSGPPAVEREAWSFTIPEVAPSGGRILVFGDDVKLQRKAAWFRQAGASVLVHQNVILWLDSALDPQTVSQYRAALSRLG